MRGFLLLHITLTQIKIIVIIQRKISMTRSHSSFIMTIALIEGSYFTLAVKYKYILDGKIIILRSKM